MKTNKIRSTGLIFLLALFTIMNLSCGGGGGSSSSGNVTAVSIKLTAAASSNVAKLKFTISAPDMATIERTVDVSVSGPPPTSTPPPPTPSIQASLVSGDIVVVNFDVPNGLSRRVVVEALDATGTVIYIGDAYVDLDGKPVNITIPMTATAPDISGIWLFHAAFNGNDPRPVSFNITISQTGNAINVSAIDPYSGNSVIASGTINGNNGQVGFTMPDGSGQCASQSTSFTGTVNGSTMSGTYVETGGIGQCINESGTWRAERVFTPSLPSGFPSNVPTGNFTVSVSVCAAGTCVSGQSFTMSNADINQFAQSMLNALNTTSAQLQASCSQSGVTCSFNIVYTPWDGASFTITDNISVTDCTGGTCVTETAFVKFTVTKA